MKVISIIKLTKDITLPEHAPILADIMIAAWRSAFRGILSDTVIEQYTQKDNCTAMFSQILVSGQGHMYLASLDGKPMGLLYWLEESETDAHLEALLTIPAAWGSGVGAALMETALNDMSSAGCQTVHVWPFSENLRAQKFYQKFGFAPSGKSRTGDALEIEYLRSL